MMRPVLPHQSEVRRRRNHSTSLGSVFRSIADSFKSQSSTSRHQGLPIVIHPTVVGGTPDQRLLFEQIRSSSIDVRSDALVKLSHSIATYSISSISEIWYAAKDLLQTDSGSEVRRNCLNLLINCIKHDDLTSASIRLTYYEDIVINCHLDYKQSQIDLDFDLILSSLEALTQDGKDIHDYYISKQYPLEQFISLSLLLCFDQITNDEVSEKFETNLIRLLGFMKNCSKFNSYMFEEDSVSVIVKQIITMVLSCSSKQLMTALLNSIEVLIPKSIPVSLMDSLLQLISYAYSFEKEMSWQMMCSLLQDPLYSQLGVTGLSEIVTGKSSVADTMSDDHITIIIGAMDLITRISIEHSENTVMEMDQVIESLYIATKLSSASIHIHILQFLDVVLRLKHELFNYQCWTLDDNSIFEILVEISTVSHENQSAIELLRRVHSSITDLATKENFEGNENNLINYYISELDKLSDSDADYLLDFIDLRSSCFVFSKYFEISISVLTTISHDLSRSELVRLKSFNLIKKSLMFTLREQDDEKLLRKFLFQLAYYESVGEQGELILQSLFTDLLLDVMFKIDDEVLFTNLIDRVSHIFDVTEYESVQKTISLIFCQLFILQLVKFNNGFKSVILFDTLIKMCENMLVQGHFGVVLIIAKVLVRLRVTRVSHFFYFTNPMDIEGLSSAFNRNFLDSVDSIHGLSWYYPELIEQLPQELIDVPSKITDGKLLIHTGKWLLIIVKVMENFYDWELYSFIWSHFCPQLSNLALFTSTPALKEEQLLIANLRVIICNQLSSELPPSLKFPQNLGKADLRIAMIRTLTALIAYHDFFSKVEEDLLIKATVDGLSTSWEKTGIPSIHFLNLCCYEIPLSVKKYLILILIKLQTRISTFFASPHILEFLMSLSHLPSLSSNFDLEEYKRIFGISFQFIEFCKINRSGKMKQSDEVFVNKHGEDVKVENVPSTEVINITPALSQYLLGLSYSVISSWFLKMKVSERKELLPFIIRNLILSSQTTSAENSTPDDQTLGFIDFVHRFSCIDALLEMRNGDLKTKLDNSTTSNWLVENSVVSIQSNEKKLQLVVRKAADAVALTLEFDTVEDITSPSLVAKYFQDQKITEYLFEGKEADDSIKAHRLIDTPLVSRSLDNLDRIPIVQFCKAGIIYIAPHQSAEDTILSNQFGSLLYSQFLGKLGQLIRLKDSANVYVGGLDTENDLDGEFALSWHDKVTQLIFHTTTLMPNGAADTGFFMKKRHVGNDYVNVYFDESGLPFDFNLIKSQFNFINIVICPVSSKYYRVKLYRRNGVPSIFAACHFKLISEARLPSFVRNLVLVSNEFSGVWSSEGQYISNWSRRIQHIRKLNQHTVIS